jgi:DNA replication factor GINS
MDLEELRTVREQERRTDSLQHLRDTFYDDAAEYVRELKRERSRRAEAAGDPYAPEAMRLTDEIGTAEEVIESLYERRRGKVVKLASFAAAGMPADTEGMTDQEKTMFHDVVERIEANEAEVLGALDDGDDEETAVPSPDAPEQGAGAGGAGASGAGAPGSSAGGAGEEPTHVIGDPDEDVSVSRAPGGESDGAHPDEAGPTAGTPGADDPAGAAAGANDPAGAAAGANDPAGAAGTDPNAGAPDDLGTAPSPPEQSGDDAGGVLADAMGGDDATAGRNEAGGQTADAAAGAGADTAASAGADTAASAGAPGAGTADTAPSTGTADTAPSAGTADTAPSGPETASEPATPDRPAGEAVAAAGGPDDSDSGAATGATASGSQSAGASQHAGGAASTGEAPSAGGAEPDTVSPDTERTTVRVTSDVGEIFGVDEREYDLQADDVVHLPTANAEPLVEQNAAERL